MEAKGRSARHQRGFEEFVTTLMRGNWTILIAFVVVTGATALFTLKKVWLLRPFVAAQHFAGFEEFHIPAVHTKNKGGSLSVESPVSFLWIAIVSEHCRKPTSAEGSLAP